MFRTQPTESSFPPIIKKSFSEEKIEKKFRHVYIRCRKETRIKKDFIDSKILTKNKILLKGLAEFFNNHVLPNFLACICFFLISYINYSLPCEETETTNVPLIIWNNMRAVLFELSFYPTAYYYLFFPLIFQKVKCSKTKTNYKISYFIVSFCVLTTFQFLIYFQYQENFAIMHVLFFFNVNAFFIFICKRNNIMFSEIKIIYALSIMFPVCIFVDYYLFKMIIIINLMKEGFSKNNKILFKIFLFVYLSCYRYFLKIITIQHFHYVKVRKLRKENNGTLVFLGFSFSDIMSSTLVPSLIYKDDLSPFLVNILFFSYQLFVIYVRPNFVINLLKKFYYYIFSIPNNPCNQCDDKLANVFRHLMIISLNEILFIIYVRAFFLHFTRKFIIKLNFIKDISDKCLFLNPDIKNTALEMIFMLILINIFIYGSVLLAENSNISLADIIRTRNKKLSLFGSVFRIILKYYHVEVFYQFYFLLSFK